MTPLQLDPSAHAPCTSTIVGLVRAGSADTSRTDSAAVPATTRAAAPRAPASFRLGDADVVIDALPRSAPLGCRTLLAPPFTAPEDRCPTHGVRRSGLSRSTPGNVLRGLQGGGAMSTSPIHHPASTVSEPVGRLAAEHPGLVKLGRAGWFTKGVVYVIAGLLALAVAINAAGWSDRRSTQAAAGGQEASPTGAIKTVADSPGGTALLWLLAIGLLLYAAWRIVAALLPGGSDAEALVRRIGYVVSAVIYATFAFSAIALARHATKDQNGNTKVTDISASIMEHTAGRWVIGAVGVIIVAAGLYRVFKGITMDVNDELDLSGMSSTRRAWTQRLGAVGEVGRGIGIGLVGFFMVRAAVRYDPHDATGLDGALRRLATASWGVAVVVVVGLGFVAYGAFCLATFTRRRLEAP